MKTGSVRRKKSVLKITEVNSPLDTGTLQLPPSVNDDDSSKKKQVRFNLAKPQLFTKDELFHFGEVPQEDISLYDMIMQKQEQVAKSRRSASVNSNTKWVYWQETVAAKINWSEMDACLCDKCEKLAEDEWRANGCKSCSSFLFLEFLDLWTFLVRMDLHIIPDPGDLKAVLKMHNPINDTYDDVQTGKFASIARDEDGVTEVASRQRDIWCYGKLVDETPLPPNSFIRNAKGGGGGGNNRRRSSLTHCRNLVPTEAPKSDSKYRAKNGIAFTRKQPEEWYSSVDYSKYALDMSSVGYPHGTLDLLGLFEKYRDLDFLIHRFNSPMYKPKNYLKRFVHADDLDSIQLFFSLLEAESQPFAPMVQRMAEIQIEGKRKHGRAKGKLWKSAGGGVGGGSEEEVDQSTAFPAGVYQLGKQSIQSFIEQKRNAKLFPKRWLKYAAFLGEGSPIEKFADKWNEWRSIYDLCFNSALITALMGSKVEIVDWLLKRDIPDCLKVYDRDKEPAMNQRMIYVDSYFSRKRRRSMACVSHCMGHQGKLLNLLINMGNRKMANYMIEKGVDVNVSSCSGQVIALEWYPDAYDDSGEAVLLSSVYDLINPLSVAAYAAAHRGSYRMVKDLIKAGANPLLCDNAALRACTAVIPGLEGLEYATKKEKKMVRNGALTIKKIMNVMRETKELSQSFCTVYLLYQAVIEKRWDTMVCLSVQPSQAKPQVRRFSFKRDGYIESLSFDSGACAVSLTVIDMLLKTMQENNLASYQRYIIGIVALLEYNQFTLDESRFQDLARLLLSILSTHGAYETTAVDQLLRLDQFRHYLTLKQEPKWKHRVVTDIIAGKTTKRVKDKTNKRASKTRLREEETVTVTEQDMEDARSSFIRVPVERPEPLPVSQIITDLLVALANTGVRSTFETLLNEPVVKQMSIDDRIFSGMAVRAAKNGEEGILTAVLDRVAESNKVAAKGIMEEVFLTATNSSLNGYCTMNCAEVVLRALDTDKKEDEETRNKIFRVAGLKLILRSIRAVLVVIRQKSEFLIHQFCKAAVMLYREDNEGINLNSWILNCLCLQDNISPDMSKINERRKEAMRLRRYVGPRPLDFRAMSVAWYGGVHIMMGTLHELAPDVVDLGGIAKSWITVAELTTPHFKGKGLALLNHFFPPVTYLHGIGVDCLLNFLCDNWEEIMEFLYFLKESGKDTEKSKQWRKLLSAELGKFESVLENASTDKLAFNKIVSSVEKQMRKKENGNGEEIGDDSASEGDEDEDEETGEGDEEEWHVIEVDEDGYEVMI